MIILRLPYPVRAKHDVFAMLAGHLYYFRVTDYHLFVPLQRGVAFVRYVTKTAGDIDLAHDSSILYESACIFYPGFLLM